MLADLPQAEPTALLQKSTSRETEATLQISAPHPTSPFAPWWVPTGCFQYVQEWGHQGSLVHTASAWPEGTGFRNQLFLAKWVWRRQTPKPACPIADIQAAVFLGIGPPNKPIAQRRLQTGEMTLLLAESTPGSRRWVPTSPTGSVSAVGGHRIGWNMPALLASRALTGTQGTEGSPSKGLETWVGSERKPGRHQKVQDRHMDSAVNVGNE